MMEFAPRTNMETPTTTVKEIAIKKEWSHLISNRNAAMMFIPEGEGLGRLVLQIEGGRKPAVISGLPESEINDVAPTLFDAAWTAIVRNVANELIAEFHLVPIGAFRNFVRDSEKRMEGLVNCNEWKYAINTEALLRIADKA